MRYVTLLALAFLANPALAGTINVPADFPTIQAAINSATDGDLILVAPGTYVESIDFLGKDIVVQSVAGPYATTILGDGTTTVVRFGSGETLAATLSGFTVTNGSPGIVCSTNSSPTITYNIVANNVSAGSGAGFVCGVNSNPLIAYNLITGNVSTIPSEF